MKGYVNGYVNGLLTPGPSPSAHCVGFWRGVPGMLQSGFAATDCRPKPFSPLQSPQPHRRRGRGAGGEESRSLYSRLSTDSSPASISPTSPVNVANSAPKSSRAIRIS